MTQLPLFGSEIFDIAIVRIHFESHSFGDIDPVLRESLDLAFIIRQQTDRPDPQIAQNLCRNPVIASVFPKTELKVRLDRIPPLVLQSIRSNLVRQSNSTALLMKVDDNTLASFVNPMHCRFELLAAITTPRTQDIPSKTL
jgi:hypothetical protein